MPSVPKTIVFKSPRNLESIRAIGRCSICGDGPVDVDHVKTRGSGGGDNLSNLNPLCRDHHIERHAIGGKSFYLQYRFVIAEFRKIHELPPLQVKFLLDS